MPVPPVAETRPHVHTSFGVVREDPYYWMREREDPAVLAHLAAENAYTEAMTVALKPLEAALFGEIVGRIKQDDASAPTLDNGYLYYTRFVEGQEYPVYARRAGTMDAPEEVLLDVNALAEGHEFYQVGGFAVTEDGHTLAYAADTTGRRLYTVHLKDLRTGETLPETLYPATGDLAWANDHRTLFYGRQDPETLRAYRVMRHRAGEAAEADPVVFEEADPEFNVSVGKSKSRRFVLVGAQQTVSSEWHTLDAGTPDGPFTLFSPRARDHEYEIDHAADAFYVLTNADGATNFKLMRARPGATDEAAWETVIPHRADVFLEGFELFQDFLVLQERRDGLTHLRIRPWDGGAEHDLDFGEPTYATAIGTNPAYSTPTLRYGYSSLTTPASVFDYNMRTRERTLVKRDPVLGDFDPARYVTERVFATAPDGTRLPISLVRGRGTPVDGTAPLLLYGYGSYGLSLSPTFSHARLSLLDRGFVYAIAHVRGGQEMGRRWYEDGKLARKMNTFTDFIAAGEHLVAEKYADPKRLYAMGGSAGGLLVGAAVNLRPSLWGGVVAQVPFVDVVTTMLDDSIPLTTFEYDEWGNPNEEAAFRTMLAYSPYDNVRPVAYPPMLVETGLHDSQVQYWEPAKWVARLRALKTDANPLLFKVNLEAGHGGASGRFQRYHEIALEYAFLLHLAGLSGTEPNA